MPHRDGCATNDDCIVNLPPPECQETICKNVAASIQSKINWKSDVCKDFKSFSCSTQQSSLRIIKSPQEIADHQMLRKFNFPFFQPSPFSLPLNPICLYNDFEFSALKLLLYPPHHCQALSLLQYWIGIPKSTAKVFLFFSFRSRKAFPLTHPPTWHIVRLTRKHYFHSFSSFSSLFLLLLQL